MFLTTNMLAHQFEMCMALSTGEGMEVCSYKYLHGKINTWSVYTDCTA